MPLNKNHSFDQPPQDYFDRSLSVYFDVIINRWKFIGYFVVATFIISTIVSFLIPKTYIATARILPPHENNSGIGSLLSVADHPLSGLAANLIGSHTPAAIYIGILKSRSVADELVRKFDLKNLYDKKYIEDVYEKLADRSDIEISKKNQIISVTVKDRDPQRAADLANTYVDILDKTNRNLDITQGKRKRLFLEKRLIQVREDLEKAELDLKDFQEKYHLISIEDQAKVVIQGVAEIKGEIIAAHTELEVFKQFGTEKQIEAIMLKAKIDELHNQLESIQKGKELVPTAPNPSIKDQGSSLFIPFDNLPRLAMQLMRFTREAKIQEKLFELITAQYEIARIEEAKDIVSIQVIDRAVPAEKKYSPKRGRIVITATLLMFFFTSIAVIGKEYQWKLKDMI